MRMELTGGGRFGAGLEIHHRHGRGGGDTPSNLLIVCQGCHDLIDPWRRRYGRRAVST